MTPNQRLDQIEPVVADLLLRQDKLEQTVEHLTTEVSSLAKIALRTMKVVEKQADNVEFLLENQILLGKRTDGLETLLNAMNVSFDKMEIAITEMNEMQKSILAAFLKK